MKNKKFVVLKDFGAKTSYHQDVKEFKKGDVIELDNKSPLLPLVGKKIIKPIR